LPFCNTTAHELCTAGKERVGALIRDRFTLGIVSGVIATISGMLLNAVSVALGFSQFYSFQLTGGIYLFPGLTDSVQGAILGSIVWFVIGGAGGILMAYLFRATGTDYWWAKSLAVSVGGIYRPASSLGRVFASIRSAAAAMSPPQHPCRAAGVKQPFSRTFSAGMFFVKQSILHSPSSPEYILPQNASQIRPAGRHCGSCSRKPSWYPEYLS
jgi:hypothetical protein